MPCLLCYETSKLAIEEIETLWLSRIEIWGTHFSSIFSVFSVKAGWIEEMFFMLLFAYVAV